MAWSDPNSASGYLIPRAALRQQGINPETFFGRSGFAGGHEQAIVAVLGRQYDAGVTWSSSVGEESEGFSRGMLRATAEKGLLNMRDIRIIWRSGPIQNGPLVGSFSERIEPRANIVRRALERAREALPDLESSEALVIGDTPHDIEGAHAVGVPVLAVASNTHSLEELQSHRPWRAMSALPEVSDFAEMLSASSSVTV